MDKSIEVDFVSGHHRCVVLETARLEKVKRNMSHKRHCGIIEKQGKEKESNRRDSS